MHNTYTHKSTPYTLTSDDWTPSGLGEVADQLVAVDFVTWAMATEWECPSSRKQLEALGVSVDSYEVVGSYYEDLTHWCDVEQKFEYMSDERVLLAPSSTLNKLRVDFTWEEIAADHGYKEWAA